MKSKKIDMIKLTQKETGEKAMVVVDHIFGALKMKDNEATALVGPGGAVVYVKETVEEIEQLLNKEKK